MLQKVNTVFVGKKFVITGAALVAGDIAVYDASTGAVIDTTTSIAATVKGIQIGYKRADGSISKTQVIGKTCISNITADNTGGYVANTVAKTVIDFTAVVPVIGNRYVIRVIYRDLYEHPGQFTHSYECIATSIDSTTLVSALVLAINAHSNTRVVASAAGDIITLTAKDVTANGFGTQGLEAITPYSQVQMRTVVYMTNPASRFSSLSYEAIPGLTIVNTESAPGKGNPFIIRDREQAALSYKGITYRTEFPVIKPTLTVDLAATYDTLVIEYSNKYQSPDNQYIKSTDLAAEIYINAGAVASADALRDKIATWAGLV